jgi:CII-binding regulator of phage lambda lysogenization HflD
MTVHELRHAVQQLDKALSELGHDIDVIEHELHHTQCNSEETVNVLKAVIRRVNSSLQKFDERLIRVEKNVGDKG